MINLITLINILFFMEKRHLIMRLIIRNRIPFDQVTFIEMRNDQDCYFHQATGAVRHQLKSCRQTP